jgi:hypothetical protein
MSRGDRREDIFHGNADRELFLKTLCKNLHAGSRPLSQGSNQRLLSGDR